MPVWVLKLCSICKKITATGQDHLDCIQMRRVRLEDDELERIPERLNRDPKELGVEIRALLEHLAREKS